MVLAMIESWELLLVVAAVALLFGTKKIPDLARSLGKAKSEFHQGISEATAEKKDEASATDKPEGDKADGEKAEGQSTTSPS